MPSFRASAAIIGARPGVPPPAVLDAARTAVSAGWQVEDAFVDVDPLARGTGLPRATIRFLVPAASAAEEEQSAWAAAKALAGGLAPVATWADLRVLRRERGRWVPVDNPT